MNDSIEGSLVRGEGEERLSGTKTETAVTRD